MVEQARQPVRVVLYLNQFFGQLGGEEAAGAEPRVVTEVVGPGRALVGLLQPHEQLVGTVICGDNYFADNPKAAAECLALVRQLQPDLVLAGPAFNAGRYGVACGALCQRVSQELKIPAVSGMYPENPGADLYHGDILIVRTGESAATMRNVLSSMLGLARKLRAGETLGPPSAEGYIPQGKVRTEYRAASAAERAADMLLAKLHGAPFETEVPLPTFNPPPAPAALPDLRGKKVALVTDGGLVPKGNPDNLESSAAKSFKTYSIAGKERLDPADYDVSHGGYDNRYVKQDPNRLVPVDAARQLEREGTIGQLFDEFLTTCGLANPVQNSRRLGAGMADYLKQAGVEAVILTST
jgi:betaine reductase